MQPNASYHMTAVEADLMKGNTVFSSCKEHALFGNFDGACNAILMVGMIKSHINNLLLGILTT